MATLKILEFPNPNLRKVAVPVTSFDNDLKRLIDTMFETMYEANGIGLAATQVDVHKRLLVLDVSEERDDPKVFVNPTIDVIESDLKVTLNNIDRWVYKYFRIITLFRYIKH